MEQPAVVLHGQDARARGQQRHGQVPREAEDAARALVEQGLRYVRVQCGGYGGAGMPDGYAGAGMPDGQLLARRPEGSPPGAYYDMRRYMRSSLEVLEHVRAEIGEEVELLHDVHERLTPDLAVQFARLLEPLGLFFLEDPLAPEDLGWFARLRRASSIPLAMGELFTHPFEWTSLISARQIDFMRMHISFMGGLPPARKAAALGELHGVRTAWHGPGDLSPVGHAVNLHLSLAVPNFGVLEFTPFNDALQEVFPGCPELRGGYLYPGAAPGIGVDLDEQAAARFPCRPTVPAWTQARLPDGSMYRP